MMRELYHLEGEVILKHHFASEVGGAPATVPLWHDSSACPRQLRDVDEELVLRPASDHRPILKELVQNIEIHPTKLKIELFSPIMNGASSSSEGPEIQKATGTDGLSLKFTKNQKSEAAILPFDPTRRAGSSTVGTGAPGQT